HGAAKPVAHHTAPPAGEPGSRIAGRREQMMSPLADAAPINDQRSRRGETFRHRMHDIHGMHPALLPLRLAKLPDLLAERGSHRPRFFEPFAKSLRTFKSKQFPTAIEAECIPALQVAKPVVADIARHDHTIRFLE